MRKLLASSAALALVLAACSGGGSTPSPTGAAPTTAATPSAAASASAPASAPASTEEPTGSGDAGEASVMLATSDLGEIVVDGAGKTLYLFTADTGGTPTCYEQCAQNWPPLLATGEVQAGDGLDDSDFGTVDRTDGGSQVTFNGHPLYYYAADSAAGDTNGQGVGGKWFVVGADGEAIQGS